jgi:hypothetical protein
MFITDLDYSQLTTGVLSNSNPSSLLLPREHFAQVKGANATAYVSGYAFTDTGYASAGAIAIASGQQTWGNTNTLAITTLYPSHIASDAWTSGYAYALTPDSLARASLYGSSHNTSFNGSSSTMTFGFVSSTYQAW